MGETTKTFIIVPRAKALLPNREFGFWASLFLFLLSKNVAQSSLPICSWRRFFHEREFRAFISPFFGGKKCITAQKFEILFVPTFVCGKNARLILFSLSFFGVEKPTSFWTCRSPCKTPSPQKSFFPPSLPFPAF